LKEQVTEAGFTSSSGGIRVPSVTREGTERLEAIRNRFEPSQVVRESFGPGRNAVTQRVKGFYCDQHGLKTLAVSANTTAQGKTPKGGTK
jgi:7-cyano-7-deazaguanine synthase in queuosine biosynthesis